MLAKVRKDQKVPYGFFSVLCDFLTLIFSTNASLHFLTETNRFANIEGPLCFSALIEDILKHFFENFF